MLTKEEKLELYKLETRARELDIECNDLCDIGMDDSIPLLELKNIWNRINELLPEEVNIYKWGNPNQFAYENSLNVALSRTQYRKKKLNKEGENE